MRMRIVAYCTTCGLETDTWVEVSRATAFMEGLRKMHNPECEEIEHGQVQEVAAAGAAQEGSGEGSTTGKLTGSGSPVN